MEQKEGDEMKIMEMAKRAKDFLTGKLKKNSENMTSQNGAEPKKEGKTDISAIEGKKGQEWAEIEATEIIEGDMLTIDPDNAEKNDGFRPDLHIIDEFSTYKVPEIPEMKVPKIPTICISGNFERTMERIRNIQEATGMDQKEVEEAVQKLAEKKGISGETAAATIEAVIAAGEILKKAFYELTEMLAEGMENLAETLSKLGKTEAQIRKEKLWKRYYEEKAKMTNNERRRRGIPMVRRPKRQQYRVKKRKKEESGNKSEEKDTEEDQEEGSGQQDDEE